MILHFPFKQQQRLCKSQEYHYVFEQPYKSTDRYLTVLARVNALDFARLGLAITKKRVKNAVARNRIKRLIRESFRHHQSSLAGWDCVVLAKSGATCVNNHTLQRSLAKHWQYLSEQCKKS